MKQRNLIVLLFASILMLALAACSPQASPVTKPAGTIEEKVLSFEYSEEPMFPLNFSGDLNSNPLISDIAVLTDHGLSQVNSLNSITVTDISLYVRAVAGVDSEGCLVLGDDAGTKMVKGAARLGGLDIAGICFGETFGKYLLSSNAQTLTASIRGDSMQIFADGRRVADISIEGAEYVFDRVTDTGLIGQDIKDIVDFVISVRDASGADYVDIMAYSPRYLFAHPAGEQPYEYAVEETVEVTQWVAVTLADGTKTTEARIVSAADTHTAIYTSEERIVVTWPTINVVTLDAAQQAAAAEAASGCFITVDSGEGPYNTAARVAETNGLTAQQVVTLREELMTYYNGPKEWAFGVQVPVTCPSEATGMTGTELGVAPAGN